MLHIEITEQERDGRDEFSRFDLARYTKQTFGMFGGSEETVRIRFHNRFVGVVIDRFGKNVPLRPDGDEHFTAACRGRRERTVFRLDHRSWERCTDPFPTVCCR